MNIDVYYFSKLKNDSEYFVNFLVVIRCFIFNQPILGKYKGQKFYLRFRV